MKKTKIIATLGPSSDAPEELKKLIEAGVNVFRLNFSHGDHVSHLTRIHNIKKVAKDLGVYVGILADLQGPKIRVGTVDQELVAGEDVILACDEAQEGEIPVQYEGLYKDVQPGDPILINDGNFELKVKNIQDKKILARVVFGGHLTSNKGINLPTASVSAKVITEKDSEDARFALKNGADFLALSFVKCADDIKDLRKIVEASENKKVKIVAKIERHEAVKNLDEIINETDMIMVARGDLGVELSPQKVPIIQKKLIKKCLSTGKPVIVATQMLESMLKNPRATRAETSDIANAILDGADATMLSGETSVGDYPKEAVRVMNRIAIDTESWMMTDNFYIGKSLRRDLRSVSEAVAHAANEVSRETSSKFIIAATTSGKNAKAIAKYRPHARILAVTHDEETARQLAISWGVESIVMSYRNNRELVDKVNNLLLESKMAKIGDTITVVSGFTKGEIGGTNMIRVHQLS